MSYIHLVFEYTKEKNKLLVVFIKDMTDFVYSTKEFLNLVLKYKDLFQKDESTINPVKFCEDIKQDLLAEFKEKSLSVTYLVYVAMKDLVYYCHRWPHGKANSFICEKVMLLDVEDSSVIDYDDKLTLSGVLIPAGFKITRNDKQADSILMSNEDSIFHDIDFNSKEGIAMLEYQKEALDLAAKECKRLKILNVLILYDASKKQG